MTLDEALETLGGLVSRSGGEGDEALDKVKDAITVLADALGHVRSSVESIGNVASAALKWGAS